MAKKNNINKLFTVLVLGGSMMAQADELSNSIESNNKEVCQIELTLKKYKVGRSPEKETVCLDKKTDEEILSEVDRLREETCSTPFCGCWLG